MTINDFELDPSPAIPSSSTVSRTEAQLRAAALSEVREAAQQIDQLKQEVDQLCAPPNAYGVPECVNEDGTVEINVDGRVSPA